MKKISIILGLLVVFSIQYSCQQERILDAGFKDQFKYTIYDYLVEHQDNYSSFLRILEAGGLDKTLSAYNPGGKTGGRGYTLFLPDNNAVNEFIQSSADYTSLDALLQDQAY